MSSGKRSEKFKSNTYIIPGILLSIIILAILSSFGIRMSTEARDQVEYDYQVETNKICNIYEKNFYAIEKAATLLAAAYLDNEDLFSDENVKSLETARNALGVENVYIVDPGYSAIDSKGQTYSYITDDERFKTVFDSKLSMNKFIKSGDGKEYLYIMKPIASKVAIQGYVIIEYVPNIMDTLLNDPKFSSRKTFALVSSDGYVIESTGKKSEICEPSVNIVDRAQDLLYVEGSYNSFRQAIFDCRSGSQNTIYKEEGRYIYYSPVNGCKASVVMIVDAVDVEKSFVAVNKNIRNMMIGIGITILSFVGVFAGIALFNKAKYNIETEDLQNKADTDLLTDLYNKVATERLIKEYLAGEGKDCVSMLFVLDVDDFKKINDTRGHAFGDQVLSSFGHSIRSWFRVGDILGRIGGDEFMIFIKDVKDPEVIRREGSRIMQFFEGFNVGEYTKYSPTASVGGAVYPTDADDFESLYKAADKAVYKSKKEGKNRVSFYADLNVVDKDVVIEKKED